MLKSQTHSTNNKGFLSSQRKNVQWGGIFLIKYYYYSITEFVGRAHDLKWFKRFSIFFFVGALIQIQDVFRVFSACGRPLIRNEGKKVYFS